MAGSPGAGRTEASKLLLEKIRTDNLYTLRIDADDLRCEFEDYNGTNSHLFQRAVSILVEKIVDFALKNNQSFLLDGTLSNYDKAESNIKRSLDKNRVVQILYVYQRPELAWDFVMKREKAEGRRIRPESFVNQYFAAREVVNKLKEEFGKDIKVDLLVKNNDGTNRAYRAGIDRVDNHLPEKHIRLDIERLVGVQ